MPSRQRGARGIALSILDPGSRRGWEVKPCPGCFTPRKETQYP